MLLVTLAEMIDRYSIVRLKMENLPEHQEYKKELEVLENEMKQYHYIEIANWKEQLYDINSRIWELEADIRKGKEGKLGLEEVGKRAIKIRDINGERIQIKNNINKITQLDFQEVKINHASMTFQRFSALNSAFPN